MQRLEHVIADMYIELCRRRHDDDATGPDDTSEAQRRKLLQNADRDPLMTLSMLRMNIRTLLSLKEVCRSR